jgi:tetratricopeptide (TPR) repeat protein
MDQAWQILLSSTYLSISEVLLSQTRYEAALEMSRKSLDIRQVLIFRDSKNPLLQWRFANSHKAVGDALIALGRKEEGLTEYQSALVIEQRLVAADPAGVAYKTGLAETLFKLGGALDDGATLRQAAEILRELSKENKLTAEQRNWLPRIEHLLAKPPR